MRLIQFRQTDDHRAVAVTMPGASAPQIVKGTASVREMALDAHRAKRSLGELIAERGLGDTVDIAALEREGRLLPPLDHADPARCVIGITGLTHLGSAASRDAMHAKLKSDDLSDSMRMFKWGVEGGKPAPGQIGVQPEWAYKGDGDWIVAPGQPITLPGYGEDGGEEGEIVGLYVIGDAGEVIRVGYALGNEFSDHVMEQRNYLYLAHSKLRQCSFGPELLIGDLPEKVEGRVRVLRDDKEVWADDFLSGEGHMCHTISNLEHHHFKYAGFRRPGDVHVYFYGASVLSFGAQFKTLAGDVMEVSQDLFGHPLRNKLVAEAAPEKISITALRP
jgi:hypothetical protein